MDRPLRVASRLALLLALTTTLGGPAWADDDFERLEGPALAGVAEVPTATRHDRLTLAQIVGLPNVLRGPRSALVVATTDRGNLARLLVAPALRKSPDGRGEPIPVLVLERFATFEAPRATTRLAEGRGLIVFDGVLVDLDSGQVVPEGQGGDLRFRVDADDGPRLDALGEATFHTFSESPLPSEPAASAGPSPGRVVVPGDFAGRYRLAANGQWSGLLDLQVDDRGAVAGRFRSDLHGESYEVEGQVAPDVPNLVRFEVAFPRVRLQAEGYLWTVGKGAMAGTLTMLDRPFGFYALRIDARPAPAEGQPGLRIGDEDAPGRIVVEIRAGDKYNLDGRPIDDGEALADALRARAEAEPSTWVVLHASPDMGFDRVLGAFEAVRQAGVVDVRLAPTP